MPIYAYRCESCGFEKDVLQRLSDTPLSQCPECGHETFRKQVTAAGFQLKGSGWYVTDFRGGNNGGGNDKPTGGSSRDDGSGGVKDASGAKDVKSGGAHGAAGAAPSAASASGGDTASPSNAGATA